MTALLLDTCAIIFIAENQDINRSARREIRAATVGDGLLVSPISAWEIGLLASKRAITFLADPHDWFQSFLMNQGVRVTPLTPEIAINSSFLPKLHADPADRLLIATARAVGVPIVTRDRHIMRYAQAGVVHAVRC
jgi:PIN domain nuclease of toxin-antitoxin system